MGLLVKETTLFTVYLFVIYLTALSVVQVI
jgi:hypothetical protein